MVKWRFVLMFTDQGWKHKWESLIQEKLPSVTTTIPSQFQQCQAVWRSNDICSANQHQHRMWTLQAISFLNPGSHRCITNITDPTAQFYSTVYVPLDSIHSRARSVTFNKCNCSIKALYFQYGLLLELPDCPLILQ